MDTAENHLEPAPLPSPSLGLGSFIEVVEWLLGGHYKEALLGRYGAKRFYRRPSASLVARVLVDEGNFSDGTRPRPVHERLTQPAQHWQKCRDGNTRDIDVAWAVRVAEVLQLGEGWLEFLNQNVVAWNGSKENRRYRMEVVDEAIRRTLSSPIPTANAESHSLLSRPTTESSLEFVSEFRSWLNAMSPEGRNRSLFPTWDDLENRRTYFPDHLDRQVIAHLEQSERCLVIGRSGSGKSVLGAQVASDWTRATGDRAFWLDLSDELIGSRAELNAELDRVLATPEAHLLVLDNAQAEPRLAELIAGRFEQTQDRVIGHRLMVLSRPLVGRPSLRSNLEDKLASDRFDLVPDGPMFAATAARLLRASAQIPTWDTADYDIWCREFGGDLSAFGQAVVAAGNKVRPSRLMAAQYIRTAYVDPIPLADLPLLDRMCAAATLGIRLDDAALGGHPHESLVHLVHGGHLKCDDSKGKRQWRLVHPGLGWLILETRAQDIGSKVGDLRQTALLEVVRSSPSSVGMITRQIGSPAYGGKGDLWRWCHAIQAESGLLETFLLGWPTLACLFPQRALTILPWHLLDDPVSRAAVVSALKEVPEITIISGFLRLAGAHERAGSRATLWQLLSDPEFATRIAQSSPEHAASFLRNAENHEPRRAGTLVRQLLSDSTFVASFASSSPEHAASFLRYAERHEPQKVGTLVRQLLSDSTFVASFASGSPEHTSAFLSYAERYEPTGVQSLVEQLLSDTQFVTRLGKCSPEQAIGFFRYAELQHIEGVKRALQTLFGSAEFLARLEQACPYHTSLLMRFSEGHSAAVVHSALADLVSRPAFSQRLFCDPKPTFVMKFLIYAWRYEPESCSTLLERALAHPQFISTLLHSSPREAGRFLKYVCEESPSSGDGRWEDSSLDLLSSWWSVFRRNLGSRAAVADLGLVMTLASRLRPKLAAEMVLWVNSTDEEWVIRKLRCASGESKASLAAAARLTQVPLRPYIYQALVESGRPMSE